MTGNAPNDTFSEPGLVLAVDPGTAKLGYALVDDQGNAAKQGIVHFEDWEGQLRRIADSGQIRTVVLGNGTNRMNIAAGITRLLPQVELVLVDETASTVEAWQLKREEEAGRNPFRQIWFLLSQMFNPVAVDDYAACVLARRYLRIKQEQGAGTKA